MSNVMASKSAEKERSLRAAFLRALRPPEVQQALQIAVLYALLTAAWLGVRGYLLELTKHKPRVLTYFPAAVDWLFALCLAGTLYIAVRAAISASSDVSVKQRESINQLVFVTEHANVGYWHWDIAADQFEWSSVGKRLLGIPQGDTMSFERFYAALHPDDRSSVEETLKACVDGTGSPDYHFEFRAVWPDGSVHWIEAIGGATFAVGAPLRMAGISFDVTPRKELELRLADALKAANAASEAKSQFLANMSHELRTPIGGVVGMLEVLLRTDLSAEQRDHVKTAVRSARDLTHVLNDVLDVSAIEAGKVSIERAPLNIRELMADKLALFRSRAEAKGIALTLALAPDVPEWIEVDAHRLRQVLRNLIGNAVKYTDRGGVHLEVKYEQDRSVLRVEVRDTGIGMSPEVQANLFQRFYQADSSASRRFEGSGLGLVICRQLVDLMAGSIGVQSREGSGSTFWFEVPAACREAPTDLRPEGANLSTTRSLRVLVADDNATARKIIEALLQALDHTVTLVDDGGPAVAAAASGAFDVILMDVMMPGMDGPTATRKIRELGGRAGGVPVIALTADVLFNKDGRYLAAGMTDCITKPIDVEQLLTALARAAAHEVGGLGAEHTS